MKHYDYWDRKYNLFYLLLMNKGAIFKQIHDLLFPKNEKTVVYKYLNKMHRRGYIDKALSGLSNGKYLYFITKKALKTLELKPSEVIKAKFKSDKPKHDLLLIDVIQKFKKLELVKQVCTDNEIKIDFTPLSRDFRDELIWSTTNPDAAVILKENGTTNYAVLELELSSKSEKRYLNLIKKYQRIKGLICLFYICKDEAMIKKLKKIVKYETFNQETPRYLFTTLENFFSATDEVIFTDYDGDKIALEVVDTLATSSSRHKCN